MEPIRIDVLETEELASSPEFWGALVDLKDAEAQRREMQRRHARYKHLRELAWRALTGMLVQVSMASEAGDTGIFEFEDARELEIDTGDGEVVRVRTLPGPITATTLRKLFGFLVDAGVDVALLTRAADLVRTLRRENPQITVEVDDGKVPF